MSILTEVKFDCADTVKRYEDTAFIYKKQKIGEIDDSDPNGVGYRIMTEDGIKVFDKDEYKDLLVEEERVKSLLETYK